LLGSGPAAADTCSGLAFETKPAQAIPIPPAALVAADFNRDGKVDLVTANASGGLVSLLLGDGSGGLTLVTATGTGLSPIDVVAGDLDRDGFLDLVVAKSTGTDLELLKGTGTSFGTQTTFDASAMPTRLGLGDFNRDGRPDLVVVSESGNRVSVYAGTGSLGFGTLLADLPTTAPFAAVAGDVNRDGTLDLAVASRVSNQVAVYLGDGTGFLGNGASQPIPFATVGTGTGTSPYDLAAGDLDRNGTLDLVTDNHGTGTAGVLLGDGDGNFTLQTPVLVGGQPSRVALRDLDRDGLLDLVVLDEAPAAPRLVAFEGTGTSPTFFDATAYPVALSASSAPKGLVLGDFKADGRADLVTALSATSRVAVVPNLSGSSCVRSSFAAAPRSYAVPDGPVSTAAADFDEDGRVDLAVATNTNGLIRVRRGVAGEFVALTDLGPFLSPPPRAVATADLNFDGHADLVAALGDLPAIAPGTPGSVRAFLGNGAGGFGAGGALAAGTNTSALAIGDFDGNGAPDVAAVSEGNGGVYVYLGDGAGGLTPVAGNPVATGLNAPRALVAADLDGDGRADLAVAESGGSSVRVLRSAGGGAFTPFAILTAVNPEGIAAGYLDGDSRPDLVVVGGTSTVSVFRRTTGGGFLPVEPYTLTGSPTAVALADVDGDSKLDIAVAVMGSRTLTLFVNNGSGAFPSSSDHPVRTLPKAVLPVDVDADGRLDIAVTCQNADAVVVLLSRLPAPTVFAGAPFVGVGSRPHGVVAADLDADGDLDLAVANVDSNTVSLLRNDGSGVFTNYGSVVVAAGPESIVAGDFNRDGRIDLAVNSSGGATPGVSVLFGSTTTRGNLDPYVLVPVGTAPNDLAVGDFDRDGDLDLAVCDRTSPAGSVRILQNNGGTFTTGPVVAVGDQPTSIVAADFDRDGDLDLAVGNEGSDDVQILTNALGSFSVSQTLTLPVADHDPLSLAVGDFDDTDVDDAPDLAVGAFQSDHLLVYRNLGAGTFATTPGSFEAPFLLQSVIQTDVNLDGRPDLLAVATGLSVFRGRGGMDFDPPETVVARRGPWAAAGGDFNRDGWADVAVTNETSNDVTLLLSTACRLRRLEVSLDPPVCGTGLPPYPRDAEVRVLDDGGNLAACAAGTVLPAIAPGTGDSAAQLGGPGAPGLAPTSGVASFTGSSFLTIDRPGRRYRLQFTLSGAQPVRSRSFTLAPDLQIDGTPSVCPGGSSTFTTTASWDEYAWALDPPSAPFAFTPAATLTNPPLTAGLHTLAVSTRVDACTASTSIPVYSGPLQSTTLAIQGLATVCLDCIGGTITPSDLGGGVPQSRQWGYRTVSGTGAVTSIPGEVGEAYVVKGSSFPGPGSYYVVVTTVPTCGTATVSSEIPVTVTTSVPTGEVQYLAASARGSSASGGQVALQWVNSTGAADEVRIRWNKAADGTSLCVPPPDTVSSATDQVAITNPSAGVRDGFSHAGLVFDTAYCYSVFVKVGTVWSPGRTVKARPFNSDTGLVKWAYSTGATAVVPPVVGLDGMLAMSNDRAVHALTRGGTTGGFWPAVWVPHALTGVAHSRSPIVPFVPTSAVFPGRSILFAGDDAGDVHAVDAMTGQPVWTSPQGKPVVGAPGGLFMQYGGVADLVLVGTRDPGGPNELRGLAVADGSLVGAPFTAGGTIGAISGSPSIDYSTQRVYFASRSLGGGPTVWCVVVDGSTPFVPCPGWTSPPGVGDVDGSPILRGGRLYVGDADGVVYSLDAATGGDLRTFTTGDGPVKGFLFPDRGSDDLIFATDTTVWSISDDGSTTMPRNWSWTTAGLNPSLVLYWPSTSFVYVGGGGQLYELYFANANTSTPPTSKAQVLGDGAGQVGAPSLDKDAPDVTAGKKLLIVGSESGVLYGVEVPF
jgi:outer membrane protein assembly factor BamB